MARTQRDGADTSTICCPQRQSTERGPPCRSALPESRHSLRTCTSEKNLTARALEFLILSATRTSETLNAVWGEIDLQRAHVDDTREPHEGRPGHRVPLPPVPSLS